jgi:hypothetical protein
VRRNPVIALLVVVCAAGVLLQVGRFALPGSVLGSDAAGSVLLVTGGWIKLAALAAATYFASRCVKLLDRENPSRRPWFLLSVGLAFFALGQATLCAYQTFTGDSPFPSIADVWFMISYPLLVLALVSFAIAYTQSGFPMTGLPSLTVGLIIVAAAIAWPLLAPIARTPAPPLATALNLAYPSLDLLLLVPTIVLLGLTSRFRGGAVWRIWAALVTGFLFTAIGDIAFAYFSTLNYTRLDPLTHAMYIVAYGSLAAGTAIQYRILAPDTVPVHNLAAAV